MIIIQIELIINNNGFNVQRPNDRATDIHKLDRAWRKALDNKQYPLAPQVVVTEKTKSDTSNNKKIEERL